VNTIEGSEADISARERDFHNRRFEENLPRDQAKYYFAIKSGEELFRRRVRELAVDADVLEYGCSVGTQSLLLAAKARSVCGIDISDVAIARARENAVDNTRFFAMDALGMSFDNASFDLVFGSGIVHHLDVGAAAAEIRRVLRPGGTAIFWEPLGHNPIINFYRRVTPSARTPDEHPLLRSHIEALKKVFSKTSLKHFGLCTLASVPFRNTPAAAPIRRSLEIADQALFSLGPLRWASWYAVIELRA
jgi:SAM-dependent methyltransferase